MNRVKNLDGAIPGTKLPVMRRKFVEFYVQTLSSRIAAERAGYSHPEVVGSQLLADPDVRAEVDKRLERFNVTPTELIARLSFMASASMEDFISINETTGDVTIDLRHAKEFYRLGLIKRVNVVETKDSKNITIELQDAQAALDKLARIMGLYNDRVRLLTWQDEIIQNVKAGKISPWEVVKELGLDDARPLLIAAGAAIPQSVPIGEEAEDSADEVLDGSYEVREPSTEDQLVVETEGDS